MVLLTNWLFDVSHYQLKVVHLDRINIKQSTAEEFFAPDDSQGYTEYIRLNIYESIDEKFIFSILITLQVKLNVFYTEYIRLNIYESIDEKFIFSILITLQVI